MRFVQFIKNNLLIISAFIVFILLEITYINKSFIDIPFLDGLMPLPMVEKYFQGKLSLIDMNMSWGEHRLIGYSLIYLVNTIFFGLNMKLEPFVFLLSYFLIGLVLYFVYKNFLKRVFKKSFQKWMEISYLPILFLIFSLVHPPAMLMTTQFVIGTLFFILMIIFFDRICLDNKEMLNLVWFFILISIYLIIFSGANFGGMILGFGACFLFKIFFFDKKRPSFFYLVSILFTIFLVLAYLLSNNMDRDGVGLVSKIIIFFYKFGESFLSILAGISATTLDIHTFEELFKSQDIFVLVNGSVLLLLGLYSIYKYIFLKMYKTTYIPLLLIFYSIGFMAMTRLGRLDGGWMWPMNDWYSFHLYFYLIGILWILFYDFFKKYTQSNQRSFIFLFKKNKGTMIIFIFSMFWIFSFQIISNISQWRRGPYVKEWLETKRMALLDPTSANVESLLWTRDDSLRAVEILKKYKLSVFRKNGYLSQQNGVIKLSGWYSDGWIGKDAKVKIISGSEGVLSMNVYVPMETFSKVYENSLVLQIVVNRVIIKELNFLSNSFDKGPVDIIVDIPKNESLDLEIKLNKSFIPINYNLGEDSRDLGIIVSKIEIK